MITTDGLPALYTKIGSFTILILAVWAYHFILHIGLSPKLICMGRIIYWILQQNSKITPSKSSKTGLSGNHSLSSLPQTTQASDNVLPRTLSSIPLCLLMKSDVLLTYCGWYINFLALSTQTAVFITFISFVKHFLKFRLNSITVFG